MPGRKRDLLRARSADTILYIECVLYREERDLVLLRARSADTIVYRECVLYIERVLNIERVRDLVLLRARSADTIVEGLNAVGRGELAEEGLELLLLLVDQQPVRRLGVVQAHERHRADTCHRVRD